MVNDTLILLGREAYTVGRFFRNECGACYREHNGKKVWIHYGVAGSGDIYGFIQGGRIVYLEMKTGNADQQTNQKTFETIVKKFGGIYHTCRSPEEGLQFVLQEAANCN